AGDLVIAQFHHTINAARLLVSSHVQNVDETGMRAGDGGESFDAIELAFEWALIHETFSINNFDGVESSNNVTREPDFAVGAFANRAKQFVVGNERYLR